MYRDHIITPAHTEHCRERTEEIRYIILHCSAYPAEKQLEIMDQNGLSAHYVIGHGGVAYENCPPDKVAYHAGESRWLGSTGKSLNDCSIGIELEAPTLGQKRWDYSPRQLDCLYQLLRRLTYDYGLKRICILGHSDVAPTRKPDPGIAFPWRRMYEYNLGTWPNGCYRSKETDEAKLLAAIGYDTSNLVAARCAFCRHFMPKEVPMEPDLQKLLAHPYPENFKPSDWNKYILKLRDAAGIFEYERKKDYWFARGK